LSVMHGSRIRVGSRLRALAAVLGFLICAPAIVSAAKARPAARPGSAQALFRRAQALLDRNTFDARRMAIRHLEQATLMEPDNASYQLTLARTYYQAGFLKSARLRFERVVAIDAEDPEGHFGLGQVWRRDWLKYLERGSLERAVEHFSTCARTKPDHVESWLMLAPLHVEQDHVSAAFAAAQHAHEADPDRAEALLAMAYTMYRLGQAPVADSVFRLAIPRLQRIVRERFHDIGPVASMEDTARLRRLAPEAQVQFLERFWRDNDPDLATRENEAQLEYWSRVAHAYFLFYDRKRREWDERGEVYVRYGPPEKAVYNPVGTPLRVTFGTGPPFPANILVWNYPSLGMTVTMQDRLLSEYYLLPITRDYDPDPAPDPDSLARRTGSLATAGGRAVFPRLAPGVTPLPIEGLVARFEGTTGPLLVAHVESPGNPADSLWAEWVVLDSTRREVSRGGRSLSTSACDAAERRVADFAAELAPGEYLVGLSVRDRRGRRGVFRAPIELPPHHARLALSDVVVSCGAPQIGASAGGEPSVRIEPNPSASVAPGEPLRAYFEIYHLRPDANGQSRFEYVYTVRSAERDPRIWIQRALAPRQQPPPIIASREEENPGALRRQFVSVPVQHLPAGKYRLEILVRDLIAGVSAGAKAEFLKTGGGAMRN
jgi:GWxTD domain-containing protein